MKNKQRHLKTAFTITELLVAIALLAALIAGSGVVFQKAIASERIAKATAEITRKLQVITDQIDRDFSALRKDGEIAIVWVPGTDTDGDGVVDIYERLDRLMFFTTGEFSTYHEQPMINGDSKYITGNLARVCYMLARNDDGQKAAQQPLAERILSRTQHILTTDGDLPDLPFGNPHVLDDETFSKHNQSNEYDKSYDAYSQWANIPFFDKERILSMIFDVIVDPDGVNIPSVPEEEWGTLVDADLPETVHKMLCQGVGTFSIQGWYYDNSIPDYRWFPMLNPYDEFDGNDNAVYTNTDFKPDGTGISSIEVPLLVYPGQGSQAVINQANFNNIPGLGRALKFTFTLYDSRGIFEDGKTFTHIVYLDR